MANLAALNAPMENLNEIVDKMVVVTHAYHVTNIPDNEKIPDWDRLQYNLANDPQYDGPLLGLPCVFFFDNPLEQCTTNRKSISTRGYHRAEVLACFCSAARI